MVRQRIDPHPVLGDVQLGHQILLERQRVAIDLADARQLLGAAVLDDGVDRQLVARRAVHKVLERSGGGCWRRSRCY
jgi:hypothetical protein